MYATLQEAYRIPAFDPRSKAKSRATAPVENFEAAPVAVKPPPRDAQITDNIGLGERITYKGQANDYKYYKDNYGLKFPEMESFSAGPTGPMGTCGAPGPLYYELPISPESAAAHKVAMDQSLAGPGPSTRPFVPEARNVDMNKVAGYVDEDLEKYLSTREPAASGPAPARFAPADDSAFAKIMKHFGAGAGAAATPVSIAHPVTKTGIDATAWDLIILVFFGLLIIFLCEQLFKLAMMLSMKETVNLLKPYLGR